MRIVVILFIVVILGSLGSALYYMIRDRGTTERTVKAHISSAGDRLCMGRVQMARLVERADLPDQL